MAKDNAIGGPMSKVLQTKEFPEKMPGLVYGIAYSAAAHSMELGRCEGRERYEIWKVLRSACDPIAEKFQYASFERKCSEKADRAIEEQVREP